MDYWRGLLRNTSGVDFLDNSKANRHHGKPRSFQTFILRVTARRLKYFTSLLFMIALIGQINLINTTYAASNFNWKTGDLGTQVRLDLSTNPNDYGLYGACTYKTEMIMDEWGRYRDQEACVFKAKTFTYTVSNFGMLYVRMATDEHMYLVRDIGVRGVSSIVPSPQTDDIVIGTNIIKDLPSKVMLNKQQSNYVYEFKNSSYIKSFSIDSLGNSRETYQTALSRNGKWMVINFRKIGYVRFNLTDMSATRLLSIDNNGFIAISNNGKYLASIPSLFSGEPHVTTIDKCGETATSLKSEWFERNDLGSCSTRSLKSTINNAFHSTEFTMLTVPEFSDDSGQLTMFIQPYGLDGHGLTIQASGYNENSSLDYLALGDSYASGEGDWKQMDNGQSHYIRNTAGEGGCHLSDESFPFLLGKMKNVPSGLVQSVACSGAQVDVDYSRPPQTYMGQGNKLKRLGPTELQSKRETAISTFQPGEIPQLEFVKTNHPKAITLMGGGNDVGFKDILTACATSFDTCQYAVPNSSLRKALGASIQGRYRSTINLIQSIQSASPGTTIYLIGYPSFVSNSELCVNGGLLNVAERSMMNTSITYMNAVLRAAAANAGANYIDLESSLNGGRICEGSKYMTGVVAKLSGAMTQELFHPNAAGHDQFAHAIISAGFTTDSDNNPDVDTTAAQPAVPAYYAAEPQSAAKQAPLSEQNLIKRLQSVIVSGIDGSFKPGSKIRLTLNSNPTLLGEFTVNAQGGFNGQITIPSSVELGYHTLLAEGIDSAGNTTRQYQFDEVVASDNDTDGDGIIDTSDSCLFIAVWRDEQTNQDVCAQPISISVPAGSTRSTSRTHPPQALLADDEDIVSSEFTSSSNGSVLGETTSASPSNDARPLPKTEVSNHILIIVGGVLTVIGVLGLLRLTRSSS